MSTDRACLDAETLAAWMDGGLDPAAVAAAESHVSSCPRCQSLVAAFARTEPLAPAAARAGARLPWRWWMAPLAATAAAVVLWMVIPEPRTNPLAPATPSPSIPAEGDRPAATVKPEVAEPSTAPATAGEMARKPAPAEPPPQFADAARERNLGAAAASREQREKKETVAAQRADAAPLAESAQLRAESARDAAAVLAPAPAAQAPAALPRMAKAAPLEIVSPDPARRWRIAGGGAIEYSADGGRSWAPVHGGGESIAAGSSPMPGVCWLVGRAGAVLLTTDGITFARVSPPADVDLVAVIAGDARVATVTAADGRVFRTTDAGQTWRPQ